MKATEAFYALSHYTNVVHGNIRLGLTNDHAKEEAVALFRAAAVIHSRYVPGMRLLVHELSDDQQEAIRRYLKGDAINYSTGIAGELTAGYGDIDPNGYWQFTLRSEYWPVSILKFAKEHGI